MDGVAIFGGLIASNATVTTQANAVTVDASGGTVEGFATVTTGIEVLITRFTAARDGYAGSDAQRDRCTLSGVDSSLGRTDTRILITDFPDMSHLAGTYWRITSKVAHPAGLGGLLSSRITLQLERIDFPISV